MPLKKIVLEIQHHNRKLWCPIWMTMVNKFVKSLSNTKKGEYDNHVLLRKRRKYSVYNLPITARK